jgi:cell division protein FtsB
MKTKYLIYLLLFGILAFFVLNITVAGDKHVTVVGENASLTEQNGQLKLENGNLKAENTKLVSENKALNEKVVKISSLADSVVNSNKEKPLQVIVQDKIEAKYGWATPDYVWDVLEFQLDRAPNKSEYRLSMLEVLNSNSLFYPDENNPESAGKKIKRSEIDSLVNIKY